MKVVILAPYPENVNKVRGGVEAVILYLIEGLQQFKDLDLHVVTLARGTQQEKVVSSAHLTMHYVPAASRLSYLTFYINRNRVKQKIMSLAPDIIDAHVAGPYVEAALQSNYPTVVTLHGVRRREVQTYKTAFTRFYKGWPIIRTERYCVKNAQHIIAISPYIVDDFNDLIRAKVYHIENPIADKFFDVIDQTQPNQILFAGIIIPRKQVLELLQAMVTVKRVVPTVQLRLAGDTHDPFDGSGQYFAELQAFIAREQLAENVQFLGNLSEEALLKEYETCSLLVLPSVQETTPMVIMQAMAAGKAVVASRVGGVPYQVEDGQTGLLIDSGDVPALAEALLKLLQNNNLRTRMGHKAKTVAEERFRTGIVARRTREVFYKITGQPIPQTSQKTASF